jgi:hypothetical protein
VPELFPSAEVVDNEELTVVEEEISKKTWAFDFQKGEFVLSPDGKVKKCDRIEAYRQWCYKALATPRFRHLAYSTDYGHEFDDLIRRNLTREANESEIQRIVTETLMVNPHTVSVEDFSFRWEEDTCYYSCTAYTDFGEDTLIEGVFRPS